MTGLAYLWSRRQCGLRVWLSRPWCTSGVGEKLGIICTRIGAADVLDPNVSTIPQDPAHATRLPMPLLVSSFIGAVPVQNIDFGRNQTYDLAVFEPRRDPLTRDAWYCDIEFETSESYFPFVRLELVRYQPNSLPDCKVSSIVMTTFLQLLPDRSFSQLVCFGV